MNWDVFRAYDIRGIYPTDIDEEAYYRIAKAYVYLFKPSTMVVGMDARLSSPALKASLIRGFLDAGVDIVDIGQITTDMLYYAVGASDYSGGIVVSASHNPKEYNGMKMVREKATAISSDTGLFDIRDALKAGKDAEVTSDKKGAFTERDIVDNYLKHVLQSVDRNKIKPFTFVAATTRPGLLSSPLRSRFGILLRLEFYTDDELRFVVTRSAEVLGVPIDQDGAAEIAMRSRGTPRIANRLLRRVRDYAQVRAGGIIDRTTAQAALELLEVDAHGFDELDRRLLRTIIEKYDGGPVGLNTLAAALAEEQDALEEVYEPFLIQIGFLDRTPRGRVATRLAYEHLGIEMPRKYSLF